MNGSMSKAQGWYPDDGLWVKLLVDSTGTVAVNVQNFPDDYPDAAVLAKLVEVLSELEEKLETADLEFDEDGYLKVYNMAPVSYTLTGQFVFTVPGELSVDTNVTLELFAAGTLTITEVYASVKTAPTGASLIIDVNKGGTTIFTTQANRPTIAAGATSDTSGTPDVTSLAKNDKLTIDVDQIGSGDPGEDLTVMVRFTQEIS